MGKKLIFTTLKDYSAEYFRQFGWEVRLYGDDLPDGDYKYLYLRDPFNDTTVASDEGLAEKISEICAKYESATKIDHVQSLAEMAKIEDKWNQAELYGDLMPSTVLGGSAKFVVGSNLAKPRISQRAKNILLELDREIDDSWIVQELLDIREELRVYVVFGKVVREATVKSSKTSGKVKVIGSRLLTDDEMKFCEGVAGISSQNGLDFVGMDIVRLADGSLRCIEVNRSPQFNRFVEIYGTEPLIGILGLE